MPAEIQVPHFGFVPCWASVPFVAPKSSATLGQEGLRAQRKTSQLHGTYTLSLACNVCIGERVGVTLFSKTCIFPSVGFAKAENISVHRGFCIFESQSFVAFEGVSVFAVRLRLVVRERWGGRGGVCVG